MTKAELLGCLRTLVNNCKLVHTSIFLLADDTAFERYVLLSCQPDLPKPFTHGEIGPLLLDKKVLPIALRELRKTVHREAIRGAYEVIKEYCYNTGQGHFLKSQPCLFFLRVLRNCWSHTGLFVFKDWERKHLPVSWSGKTIDLTLEGKQVDLDFLSYEDLLLLIKDVERFIEEKLN